MAKASERNGGTDAAKLREKVSRIREEVDKAKADRGVASGRLQSAMDDIKAEFGAVTFEEAEAELARLDEEVASITGKLERGLQEIEDTYEIV